MTYKINQLALAASILTFAHASLFAQGGSVKGEIGINGQTVDATATVQVVGEDTDGDGLLDSIEDANGNGQFDVGETDFQNPDTDGDGLLDGQEDANGNGQVDSGESSPLVNQFSLDPDWSGVSNFVQSRMRDFWDFESYNNGFAGKKSSNVAVAEPNKQAVWNEQSGNLGKSVSLGKGTNYLEIHPKKIWEDHRKWNLSFTIKLDRPPLVSDGAIPIFSVHSNPIWNNAANLLPDLQISIINGTTSTFPNYTGLFVRLHGTASVYAEWRLPNGVDLTEWNHFGFNSDGALPLNDRFFIFNGVLINRESNIATSPIMPSQGGTGINGNDAKGGYILLGATKIGAGVVSVSSIGISMDRLAISRPLSENNTGSLVRLNTDTDGDGMTDLLELKNGFDPLHYDANADRDNDGLTDFEEINPQTHSFGPTNPGFFDSDGDLFSDGWEVQFGFNPNDGTVPIPDGPGSDPDGDGLSNFEEFIAGTDPRSGTGTDTDGDLINDGDESEAGSDPNSADDKPFDPTVFYGDDLSGLNCPDLGYLGGFVNTGDFSSNPKIKIKVGDHSGSKSERWQLNAGNRKVQNKEFGTVDEKSYRFSQRRVHEITLHHVGTKLENAPDYDYTTGVEPTGSFILCDEDGLLGMGNDDTEQSWKNKKAYLVPYVYNSYASSFSLSYSGSDAVGPRYRKVSLNGRPMPDNKPEAEGETDMHRETTYVDAFNLGLHHDTSYVHIPLGASDLVIEASASLKETSWSDRSGLRPKESLTSPFGVCWSSNLCSYIEIIETIGDAASDPIAVQVVDEGGRSQRFGTVDFQNFFVWPSSRVDKKTYLNTLTRNGDSFIYKKKYGNELTFRACKAWQMYGTDRIEGSDKLKKHTYWRLEEVRDRYGNRLKYDYGNSEISLIPTKISSPERPGQEINITRSTDCRRVESIVDPRGNTTTFTYEDITVGLAGNDSNEAYRSSTEGSHTAKKLVSVHCADGTIIGYDYGSAVEVETDDSNTPSDNSDDKYTFHAHINLTSTTDKRGNAHSFEYTLDTSKRNFTGNSQTGSGSGKYTLAKAVEREVNGLPADAQGCIAEELIRLNGGKDAQEDPNSNNAAYKQMYGVPRLLHRVILPDNIGTTTFTPAGTNHATYGPEFSASNSMTVTDCVGSDTTYTFGNVAAEQVDVDINRTLSSSSVSVEWMIYYTSLSIDHAGLGTETYSFDLESGLSLQSVTDFSGNLCTWEYGDAWPVPAIPMTLNGNSVSKWADPTKKTDALGRTVTYKYSGNYRIMSETVDEKGTKTVNGVDGLGRRTSMTVTDSGGNILREEQYRYDSVNFPAFMTRKTVKTYQSLSGQTWEQDLVTQFVPDSLGRAWKTIVDPEGLGLTTINTYDSNNNRLTTLDPRGNRIFFEYDKLNRLVKTTYPIAGSLTGERAAESQIYYDANSNKVAQKDAEGRYVIYLRDALNRVVTTIVDMDGQGLPTPNAHGIVPENAMGQATAGDLVSHAQYNAVSSVTSATDPRGTVTRTFYDGIQRPRHVYAHFEASDADAVGAETGNSVATSSEKTHTELRYDQSISIGGVNHVSNPGGSAFNVSGFKPVMSIRHHAVSTENGTESFTSYQVNDALYRPLRTENQFQNSGANHTENFRLTQTSYGSITNGKEERQSTAVDHLGKVTVSLYDGLNRNVSVTDAYGTSLASTTQTFYSSTGLVWKVIDPMNRESETDYDLAGRPVKVWSPDPVSGVVVRGTPNDPILGSPVTETVYDANSNVMATINPLGHRWDFTYDARNRKTREMQPSVANAENPAAPLQARPVVRMSYDAMGNVIQSEDARHVISKIEYDFAYRATKTWGAFGTPDQTLSQAEYDFNGNVIVATDPNGNKTRNTYDVLNRLVVTSTNTLTGDPSVDPSSPHADDIVITNTYDDSGNLILVTDGKGQKTGFTYDGLSRKTKTIWDPGTAVERVELSTYDALLQTGRTDPKAQVTNFTYDALHRLEDVTYVGRTQDNRHMDYDLSGNLLDITYPNESLANKTARRSSQTYDHLNRVIWETSNGVTHGTTYDKAGNTITQTYGRTGRVLTCTYDALNRLLRCSETSGAASPRVTNYAYDHNGNITRKTLPNLTYTDKVFDALNRCTSTTNLRSNATIIHNLTTTYDTVGNVTQCIETSASTAIASGTLTTSNGYDKAYRLLTETRTDTGLSPAELKITSYAYDKANNRTTKTIVTNGGTPQVTTYNFGGTGYNSNQLVSYNRPDTGATVTFTYDANGNRATRTIGANTDTYSYDYDNRLVSLGYQTDTTASKNGTYTYQYDHRTRRVNRNESAANGDNTLLVFSGGLSVQEHTTTITATPAVEYVRGCDYGGGVGGVLYTLRSGTPSYNYYNSRGDVLAKTDNSGATTWQANYEAFGTRTAENGTNDDRQKANTKDEDPHGLLNEGMRYRDLEAGIFITRDPAGFVDGPNVYTYVRQNPWSAFDPHGLAEEQLSKNEHRQQIVDQQNRLDGLRENYVTKRDQFKKQAKAGGDINKLKKEYDSARKNYIKQANEIRKQLDKSVISYFRNHGGKVQEGVDIDLNPKQYSSKGMPGVLMDGSKLQDRENIITIYAHSNERKIHDQRKSKTGEILDATQLSDVIKKDKNYQGAVGVLIYGCNCGALADGLSAQVAKKTGLPTLAPDKSIWVGKSRDVPFIAGRKPHPRHPMQHHIMDPNNKGSWRGSGPTK